ncbi:MAG: branched-chain amino acid transport system permease protein [Chloroflexota bacterium]|jgi:branched-chain amino acid transport system permease protein/neutral amino acid transport system permease protein|nr:branched-chain amino acid transport system permease protein [Chloroflexota bacterium]MEA2644471.1 branched-chain amino acid transport system permease protein [Chloroflexota bacterium]
MSQLIPAIGFGLITASILAIAAVGFTLQFSVTNILNLAYGDIMTASAFAAYIANQAGVNIWICLVIAALFGAVFSMLINRLVYFQFVRRGTRLFGMIIVTIAMSLIIQNLLLAIFRPTFFSYQASQGPSYNLGSMVFTASQLAIMGIAVVAMLGVHLLTTRTRLGKAMRATATNPSLARSCGISTDRVIDLAWLVSGALCGIAGVVLVLNTATFSESTGAGFLVPVIAAAVLGGIGHPYGAMLGALTIGIATEASASVISPAFKEVVAFLILIVVLLVRPQGILSEIASAKEVAA